MWRSKLILWGWGLVVLFSGCQKDRSHNPPNILFITIDDLRPELGCYGINEVFSPHIDQLAAEGTRFEQAFCSVSWCSPSRTSLLTGMRPAQTEVMDLKTHFRKQLPNAVTLPQFFKSKGYQSQGFGKIYHNSKDLQDDLSWDKPCWLPPMDHPIQAYASRENIEIAASNNGHKSTATESVDVPDNAYPDGMVTEKAIEALQMMKENGKPFFLGVGYYKPHLPFTAPKKYWDLYQSKNIPLPNLDSLPQNAAPYIFREWSEPGSYLDINIEEPYHDSLSRHLKLGYFACVSFIDAQVGLLMEKLEQLNLAENTIVVVWGDHGWKLGEYGRWSKHSNMDIDTRVPLIIKAPGASPKVVNNIVETIDIYPTLAKLCGFETPVDLQGEDLFNKKRNFAISQIPRDSLVGNSIRTPDFRFIQWENPSTQNGFFLEELYDHRTDHLEKKNLANDENFTERIQSLRLQLQENLN